jgi:hypothetical protein
MYILCYKVPQTKLCNYDYVYYFKKGLPGGITRPLLFLPLLLENLTKGQKSFLFIRSCPTSHWDSLRQGPYKFSLILVVGKDDFQSCFTCRHNLKGTRVFLVSNSIFTQAIECSIILVIGGCEIQCGDETLCCISFLVQFLLVFTVVEEPTEGNSCWIGINL